MKVAFAIFFFCFILGVTTAKHLVNGEFKGFETDEDDVAHLMDNTMYDEEETKIVTSHLLVSIYKKNTSHLICLKHRIQTLGYDSTQILIHACS